MTRIVLILAVLGLTACGVDGPPTPPAASGVSVNGTVEIGVSGT